MQQRIRALTSGFFTFCLCIFVFTNILYAEEGQPQKVFQNQLHSFGGNITARIHHALQMGYDYVLGQPWSDKAAQQQSAAGLKVLFNSTAGDEAKWLRFNNPGGAGSVTPPSSVNAQPISSQLYTEMTKTLCMKDVNAPNTDLKRKYRISTKYESSSAVLFYNNYRCSSGIDAMVRQNEWLYTLHGGAAVYDGLFLDQVNAEAAEVIPSCFNPCLTDPTEVVYPNQTVGQLEYIRRIRNHFKGVLKADGVSGNPWKISKYADRQLTVPLDLLHNESGIDNNPATWDGVPPTDGAVQIFFQENYSTALNALGVAGINHAWFGWYGGDFPGESTNSTQLARALPNWDNLVGATNRQWNSLNRVYRSSNSYADPNLVYGRHPKTGKLFVVFQNLQGAVQLRPGEVVKDVKQVDKLFIEATDGQNDLTINGSLVSLANTQHVGEGYIITTDMKNSIPIADAGTNQTVNTGAVVQLNGSGSEDADGDPLTYSWNMVTVPQGSQATLYAPQTAQPSFVPNKAGQYVVRLLVNDGKTTSAPASVTITAILPKNSKPTAHSQTLSTSTMKAVKTVLSGSDPDGDPLTFQITVPPVNGTLNGQLPQVTYTPKSGFSGSDLIVFRTHDGQEESDPATVSVQVTPTFPKPKNLVLNSSFEESPAFSLWAAPKPSNQVSSVLSIGSAPHGTASAQINVLQAGQTAYVALRQTVTLSPNGTYRLRFWAKASSNRKLTTLLIQDKSPWDIVGLWGQASLSSQWQQFDKIFTYTGVEPNARLVFRMGNKVGTVWIDNVELIAQP